MTSPLEALAPREPSGGISLWLVSCQP